MSFFFRNYRSMQSVSTLLKLKTSNERTPHAERTRDEFVCGSFTLQKTTYLILIETVLFIMSSILSPLQWPFKLAVCSSIHRDQRKRLASCESSSWDLPRDFYSLVFWVVFIPLFSSKLHLIQDFPKALAAKACVEMYVLHLLNPWRHFLRSLVCRRRPDCDMQSVVITSAACGWSAHMLV